MIIRELRREDLDAIVDVLKELWIISEITEKTYDRIMSNDNFVFVAVHENEIIGCATLHLQHKFINNGCTAGLIEEVIVKEKYRGNSIGKELIDKCVEKAKELKCYKAVLSCEDDIRAFYEKLGFRYNMNFMRKDL